jgi:hypothetical protein
LTVVSYLDMHGGLAGFVLGWGLSQDGAF